MILLPCLLDFTAMYHPCPTFRICSMLLCFINFQERNVICHVSLRSLAMAVFPEPHSLPFPALKGFHFLTELPETLRNHCSAHYLSLLLNIPVALSAFPHPSYAGQRQPPLRIFFAGEAASSPSWMNLTSIMQPKLEAGLLLHSCMPALACLRDAAPPWTKWH